MSEKRKEQTNPNDIFWDDKWGCKIKLKNGDTYYVFWRNIDWIYNEGRKEKLEWIEAECKRRRENNK